MNGSSSATGWRPERGVGELPCQNCGKLVTVSLPFIGCVFCGDCFKADSGWDDGTEQFNEPRRLTTP